ncbi:MAG TPA: hypothetical protein P5184_02795, partial [Bacteroidales bacterium]|nr:hypothetical protein [Bacteroidales bacterium]
MKDYKQQDYINTGFSFFDFDENSVLPLVEPSKGLIRDIESLLESQVKEEGCLIIRGSLFYFAPRPHGRVMAPQLESSL